MTQPARIIRLAGPEDVPKVVRMAARCAVSIGVCTRAGRIGAPQDGCSGHGRGAGASSCERTATMTNSTAIQKRRSMVLTSRTTTAVYPAGRFFGLRLPGAPETPQAPEESPHIRA